jgi:hypothetical protein
MFRITSFRCIRPFGLRGKEQPIHAPVSPAPSKIPYGEFSPVRLQTSIRVPPSSAFHRLIGTFLPRRRPPALLSGYLGFRPIRTRRTPRQNHSSSGPWLRSRFYCPAASSLTMATSEPLQSLDGLFNSSTALRKLVPQTAEGPQFTLPVLWHVPSSISRRFQRFHPTVHPSPVLFSSNVEGLNNRVSRPIRSSPAPNGTAKFALCYGPHHCSPLPVGTFTSELSLPMLPSTASDIATWQQSITTTGLSPVGHAALWAATTFWDWSNLANESLASRVWSRC